MPSVTHPTPVVVRHPLSEQFIALARGMEFEDSDPVVEAYPWAFVASDVESATAEPGKRRYVRRPKPDAAEQAEPQE